MAWAAKEAPMWTVGRLQQPQEAAMGTVGGLGQPQDPLIVTMNE